jgi:hypothetical protein
VSCWIDTMSGLHRLHGLRRHDRKQGTTLANGLGGTHDGVRIGIDGEILADSAGIHVGIEEAR